MAESELFQKCARLFMVGFPGKTPTDEVLKLIDDGVYGVILFSRNIDGAEQVSSLISKLKLRARRPLALAVDQEGGRVARLRGEPFTDFPSMRAIAAAGDTALAARVGTLLAYELRSVGFDWDFAPVLDVDTNPQNPVIGDRSFSREADLVARMGVALGRALEAGGIASCGKHFPGHGDTSQDSHLTLPRLKHDLARLNAVELLPFAAWAKAGLSSVMTAHVVFEALDADVPATMSGKVLHGLLRQTLAYTGVVVSDDLEMKAIAANYGIEDAVVKGVLAGVDLFLVCQDAAIQRSAISALEAAVKRGTVSTARLQQSLTRVDGLARRFVKSPKQLLARLGSPEHLALREGIPLKAALGADPTERA